MNLTVLVPQDLAELVKVDVAILVIAEAASAVLATLYDLQRDIVDVTVWTPGHDKESSNNRARVLSPAFYCWKTAAMLIEANPSEIRAILGAMQQVITARSMLPISEIDKKTLYGAYQYMFGQTGDLDIGALPRITPNELASALTDRELSINALRFMAVCAFVDGALNKQRIDTVLDFAKALDIREDYIAELTALAHDDLRWVMADMSRRNIESLVNHPWTDDDANAWLLPYRDRSADPSLAARYESLRDCPNGSLGKAFWHHFKDNGYPFPGEPDGLNEIFATPHDSTHILSGYNTTFQGEILVSTFTAGMHQREPMASHVLPVILLWHLGLRSTR